MRIEECPLNYKGFYCSILEVYAFERTIVVHIVPLLWRGCPYFVGGSIATVSVVLIQLGVLLGSRMPVWNRRG